MGIVAVSFKVDEKGKEHPGFAHALVVEDASTETLESALKRLGLPEEEIVPLIGIIRTVGGRSYQTAFTDFEYHNIIGL